MGCIDGHDAEQNFSLEVRIPKTCRSIEKHSCLIPLGFEPRTSRVLGERDNHYTMESGLASGWQLLHDFNEVNIEYFVSCPEHL